MPDYNLGRAHGTVKVDYDGTGVRQATGDLNKLGDTSEKTGERIRQSSEHNQETLKQLMAAMIQLQGDVVRATVQEAAAKSRLKAAEESLAAVRAHSASSAQDVKNAEKNLEAAQVRSTAASLRLANAQRAVQIIQERLARTPQPKPPSFNTRILDDFANRLRNIDRNTSRSALGVNTFSGRLKALVSAVALASPTVAGLGVSLVALAGAAGIATGALAALLAVGATLAVSFSGIGEVFKQAANQQKTAGASATQSANQQRAAARQVEQALRSIRDAHEAVARAQEDAARGAIMAARDVIAAERSYRDAQVDSLHAQLALNRARIEAARFLQDLRDQLVGGALDERQAIIDVQRAQQELNKVLNDPRVSALDRQQAILTLEKEQHALEEVRKQNVRLGEDQEVAAAKGVEGSDAVTSAQQDVLHSTEAVLDASNAVRDAVFEAARQQVDSQRAVRDAIEGLIDANKDLQDAQEQAAQAGTSGAAKMADAMANISPEARKLVGAILEQQGAWQKVKFAIQDAAFKDLSKDVEPMARIWLPLLEKGLGGIAQSLNSVAQEVLGFLESSQATEDVTIIFDNTRLAVQRLAPAIRDLIAVFFDISAVGSSFLPDLANKIAVMTHNWRDNVEAAKQSGRAHEWMAAAIQAVRELGALLGNLIGIVVTLFTAFDQEGGSTLAVLVNMTQKLEDFLHTAEGHDMLVQLGQVLAELGRLVGVVLIAALDAFGSALIIIGPDLQDLIHMIADQLVVALVILKPLLQGIAFVFDFLGPILVPLVATMISLNKVVWAAGLAWKALNLILKTNIFILIASAIVALAFLIFENWDAIVAFLTKTWQWIEGEAAARWEAIKQNIINPVANAIGNVITAITTFVGWLRDAWNLLWQITADRWAAIKSAIIDPIANAITTVLNFFHDLRGNLAQIFSNAKNWLWDAGRNIIEGLLNGLKNVGHRIIDFFRNLIGDAVDSVLNMLGISSPSKVFQDIAEFTWQGYLVGTDDMEHQVIQRMVEISAQITRAGQPDPTVLTPALTAAALPTARSFAGTESGNKTVIIQNLTIPITGNLDPTNPVQWRRAMQDIRETIRNIEKQEKVA